MMRRSGKRMTLVELKRHMDRRFDRLQRTKADKVDLQRFATKDDLRRFATKEDLRRFATKDDLTRFATKDDFDSLRRLVADVMRKLDGLHGKVDSLVRLGNTRHTTYMDAFSEHEIRLRELEGHPTG